MSTRTSVFLPPLAALLTGGAVLLLLFLPLPGCSSSDGGSGGSSDQTGGPTAQIIEPADTVTIAPGGTVTFTGAGSGGTGALTLSWNFDTTQGGGVTPGTGSGTSPDAVTYALAGTFTVRLTVTDEAGESATASRDVVVQGAGGLVWDEGNWGEANWQ